MTQPPTGFDFECAACGRRHHFATRPSGDEVVCPFCDARQLIDHPHRTVVFSTTGADLWEDSGADGEEPEVLRAGAVFSPGHLPRYRLDDARDAEPTTDFLILSSLGQGGMGEIFQARQASVERTVALKMIRTDIDRPEVARNKFMSEVAVSSWLEHPNIVPVHELGLDQDDRPFYTMRQIVGVPWSAVMRDRSLSDNLDILLRVCDAVSFAHSRGILHRDLKPSNVMLGEFGEIMVMDWGIAVAVEPEARGERLRPANAIAGSPSYMAPEMARGDIVAISYASDVYLLGAILFKVVTGTTPHVGRTSTDCIEAAAENEMVAIDDAWRGELLDIALRALASDPAERHPSVRAFSQDLRSYREHRESLLLTDLADAQFQQGQDEGAYAGFSRAIVGYDHAIDIWAGNERARRGREHARLAYARCAFAHGDLDLAESQLDADDPDHQELLATIRAAQEERTNLEAVAERERRQARWEAARNRVTARFLLDILAKAAPDQLGPNTTVLEAISDASERIDERFADDPENLANLHLSLGIIERDIERLDQAAWHLQRAGEILRDRHGDNAPPVTAWRNEWGQCLLAAGRLDEAEEAFAEVLAAMHREHEGGHPNLLAAMNNLANVYQRQGRYDEAASQYRDIAAATTRSLGAEHPTSLVARANLAGSHLRQGDLAAAETMYREVLEDQLRVLGPTHPHTLSARTDLARICYLREHYAEARTQYQALLEARTELFGRGSAEVATTAENLAKAALADGDLEAAAAQAEGAIAVLGELAGVTGDAMADARLLLAEVRFVQGRSAEAVELAAVAEAEAEGEPMRGGAVLLRGLAVAAGGELAGGFALAVSGLRRLAESLDGRHPRLDQGLNRLASLAVALLDAEGSAGFASLDEVDRGLAGLALAAGGRPEPGSDWLAAAAAATEDESPLGRLFADRLPSDRNDA